MTETEVESRTKSSGKKDKDYSIKCEQNVCVIKYKGEIRYRRPFKWVPLVNLFGEYAIRFFGTLEIILGIIGALIFCIALGEMPEDLKSLKEYLVGAVVFLNFFVSLYLVLDGIFAQSNAKFVRFLKCKRCGRKNAYEEREKPDIREDSTENLYTVTITRYWKCKYCGYLDSSQSSENIKCFKIKKKKPIEMTCEKCGKTSLSSECRNPDMKREDYVVGSDSTEIRYYECNYCGHLNIETKKNHLNYMEPLANSETKRKDPRL
ncbi:hypothetical protein MSBR3_1781 [Methanosarcina barkeri 3]|uniref:Uncharacterized protein n=1 Tax=Methanosarcina barkeri 3 TaxID=1434107 RepID=A0A0E3WYC1_METBA|nr:hypothetical protein [Methanosarcina barkeri]AKB82359.1 hypothetical protein MSBR3_1781 [Methanosarcina barkeri 3]